MKLFLSKDLYGIRSFRHCAAYHQSPGWLFVELGGWTLEVDYDPPQLPRRAISLVLGGIAFCVALLFLSNRKTRIPRKVSCNEGSIFPET